MACILIGADICPIARNRPLFIRGDARGLLNDLLGEFESSDLVLANLECPLIEQPSPIAKTGPTFGELSACIKGIKAAQVDVVGLANNHSLDHGAEGLANTLRVCDAAGIACVGAGANRAAARRIGVQEVCGLRIGILAVAEHEFSIATDTSWGANPVDLVDCVRNIREHRDALDYLIVLFHGGDEFYDWPSPRIRETCRFLVETGADCVVVQHPHCLGGYETYRNGHIVYGQGAVIMDEPIYRHQKCFHEGCLVRLNLNGKTPPPMDLIPFRQSEDRPGARRMAGGEAENVLRTLAEKAKRIQDDAYIEAQWRAFCQTQQNAYLSTLLGHGRVLRKLNALGWITKWGYRRQALLGTRNVVCCETHREILETNFRDAGM